MSEEHDRVVGFFEDEILTGVMGSHNAIIMLLFALYTAGLPNGAFYQTAHSHIAPNVCVCIRNTHGVLIHHYIHICVCVELAQGFDRSIAIKRNMEMWHAPVRPTDI